MISQYSIYPTVALMRKLIQEPSEVKIVRYLPHKIGTLTVTGSTNTHCRS